MARVAGEEVAVYRMEGPDEKKPEEVTRVINERLFRVAEPNCSPWRVRDIFPDRYGDVQTIVFVRTMWGEEAGTTKEPLHSV